MSIFPKRVWNLCVYKESYARRLCIYPLWDYPWDEIRKTGLETVVLSTDTNACTYMLSYVSSVVVVFNVQTLSIVATVKQHNTIASNNPQMFIRTINSALISETGKRVVSVPDPPRANVFWNESKIYQSLDMTRHPTMFLDSRHRVHGVVNPKVCVYHTENTWASPFELYTLCTTRKSPHSHGLVKEYNIARESY